MRATGGFGGKHSSKEEVIAWTILRKPGAEDGVSILGKTGRVSGGNVANRPMGAQDVIPWEALRSARSCPGMPGCDFTFLSSTSGK